MTVTSAPMSQPEAGRPYLIGVAGGSSSGKTMVSERLAALAGVDHLALIKLDSYYWIGPRTTSRRGRRRTTTTLMRSTGRCSTTTWRRCASVQVPVYDYTQHLRSGNAQLVHPSAIVVVEGILVLWEPTLRDRFDLKIYMDTDADVRLIRRLRRDVAERGRTPEAIMEQYLSTVRPSHEQFVEPSKRFADVIIPEGGLNRPAIDVLLARVRELVTPAGSHDLGATVQQ